MRRLATAALVIAWLQRVAVAGPGQETPPGTADHDPVAAPTPWLDEGPAKVLEPRSEPARPNHKIAASLTLGGIYAGFATWTYFAWYRKHKPLAEFAWGGDGWLGARTYAGGADKFGHAWATMGLARAGTELLHQWGGFGKTSSAIIGTALSEALFFAVEVKDGFYYEFSFSDFTGDSIGAGLALAFSLSPRLDELFDYRVQYWPSAAYRKQFDGGNVNIAEDYTGETYLLALHLGAIGPIERCVDRHLPFPLMKFVDVAVGYGTRGYKPDPPSRMLPDYDHHQDLSVGLSLNAQGLFDWLLSGHSAGRKVTHGFFEVFNAPYTYGPILEHQRTPDGMVNTGGA